MKWEIIVWSSLTFALICIIIGIILAVISAINVRKKMKTLKGVHQTMQVGSKVMIASGIYGKIVKMGADTVDVEIAKGVVIQASRYAISNIE